MTTNPPPEERKLDSFNSSPGSTTRRKRTVFKKDQIHILKNYYQKNPYPGFEEREQLSRMTNIAESRIHLWFQNRRARVAAQQKKQISNVSTSLRQMCQVNTSPGPILKEDFSEQELAASNAFGCPSWAGEPGQETGPSYDCSSERSATSTTEKYGYDILQRYALSSQNMAPPTEFEPHALPRPMYQGSSSQWATSWALQGTQETEKYDTSTSFYGGEEPLLCVQEQDQRVKQLDSNDHPLPFQCAEETSPSLQQPHPQQNYPHLSVQQPSMPQDPTFQVQQRASSLPQLQDLQDQSLPPLFLWEEEQLYESHCSNHQEPYCSYIQENC